MPDGMSADVRWERDNIAATKRRVGSHAGRALLAAAAFGRAEANKTIPLEEGTLQRSGGVEVDEEQGEAAFFWDTPYAVRQHEDTTLSHDPGRRAKFAELTLSEQANQLQRVIADGLRGAFR